VLGRHETSSCSKYTCTFLQALLVSSGLASIFLSEALYIKSSQAASPRTSRPHVVADDEAAPVVSVHRTLLGGELAPSGTIHVAALTPTRICASIWREPGPGLEEVGEEVDPWEPFGWCLINLPFS
jgi:hypothetical protein